MYLIGLVEYDNITKSEDASQPILKRRLWEKPSVRQVMLKSFIDGVGDTPLKTSKPLVKAVTIMALQPLGQGAGPD